MKTHKCDDCAENFTQKGNMMTHINSVHNDRKDHKCDTCGKLFSRAQTLIIHINAVRGQKGHK